jgi:hypothetical protein
VRGRHAGVPPAQQHRSGQLRHGRSGARPWRRGRRRAPAGGRAWRRGARGAGGLGRLSPRFRSTHLLFVVVSFWHLARAYLASSRAMMAAWMSHVWCRCPRIGPAARMCMRGQAGSDRIGMNPQRIGALRRLQGVGALPSRLSRWRCVTTRMPVSRLASTRGPPPARQSAGRAHA